MPLKLESIGDESNIEDFENTILCSNVWNEITRLYFRWRWLWSRTNNRTMLTIEVEETRIVSDIVFDTDKKG
jgi:hypothetical protein